MSYFVTGKQMPFYITLILLIVIGSSYAVIHHINKRILELNQEKIVEVTRKGATILQNELENKQKDLRLLARILPPDTDSWEECLRNFLDVHHFFRITLITEDGTVISNRSLTPEQLSRIQALAAQSDYYTSTYIGDSGKPQHMIHFSFQVHSMQAHIYAENKIEDFYNESAMQFFEKQGFSYVISKDTGKFLLMAKNKNSQGLYSDLYTMLEDNKKNHPLAIQKLKTFLNDSITGTALFYFRDISCHFCFVPVVANADWYFLSIIPRNILENMGDTASTFILFLVFICTTCCIIIFFTSKKAYTFETKYHERAFRESLFNSISSSINMVISVYNPTTRKVEFLSENMERITGFPHQEYLKNPNEFLKNCENPSFVRLYGDLQMGSIHTYACEETPTLKKKSGERIWLRMTSYPVQEGTEASKNILTFENITHEKETQTLLRDAMLSAQRANEAKSVFLTNMSHEIRTPMNAIIGMTLIAQMNQSNPKRVTDCLKKITGASRHLLNLINDILDMSKITSGKMALSNETFSLSNVIDEVINIMLPQLKAKKHHFETYVDCLCDKHFSGDPLRIQQILLNLLSNAVKYTPPSGKIFLRVSTRTLSKKRCEILFTIQDNGIGMSEEYQKIIFEPFSQEKTTLSNGTGIGMAITHNIIQLMGGDITLTSTQDKGTTFQVRLVLPTLPSEIHYNTCLLAQLRALIADDDPDIGVNAVTLLRELEMEAEAVTSGAAAVKKVEAGIAAGLPLDVIILDWKMPGMDGLTTAKEIKRLVGNNVPIVILSAYDWSSIEQEAYACGVTTFISKPLFKSKLYETLIRLMEKHSEEDSSHFKLLNPTWSCSGKRLLLAEDNMLNAEIAVEILNMQGASVDVATNGEEAVQLFKSHPPHWYDLILMDIQMPICDGYQATQILRSLDQEDAQTIPIVAMTANAFSEDKQNSLASGMNGYLTKPIDFEELNRTMQRLLLE